MVSPRKLKASAFGRPDPEFWKFSPRTTEAFIIIIDSVHFPFQRLFISIGHSKKDTHAVPKSQLLHDSYNHGSMSYISCKLWLDGHLRSSATTAKNHLNITTKIFLRSRRRARRVRRSLKYVISIVIMTEI